MPVSSSVTQSDVALKRGFHVGVVGGGKQEDTLPSSLADDPTAAVPGKWMHLGLPVSRFGHQFSLLSASGWEAPEGRL